MTERNLKKYYCQCRCEEGVPVSNKTLIQRWYMVGMVGRTSQLACQREQPNRWVDPMLVRRMIFDGEMCSRLANVGTTYDI